MEVEITRESAWLSCFGALPDPRIERKKLHKLMDILVLTLCAVMSGATSWETIEDYAKGKKEWLKTFLELPNGIPSHDTIARVFGLLDPVQFGVCFRDWIARFCKELQGVIAIDGKRLCAASMEKGEPIHIVSAFAADLGLVLAQCKVGDKSNEITAIPELLNLLSIKGCIVTIDAMGCQTDIAKEITDKQADYVLSLKGNQSTLHDEVSLYLDSLLAGDLKQVKRDEHTTLEKGHGRIENRHYLITDAIDWLEQKSKWKNLKSIGVVQSERTIGSKVTTERRYFICSIPADAKKFAYAVRNHWSIENQLHWVLDVSFSEDQAKMCVNNAAQNMAVLRHSALNLLRLDPTGKKMSIKRKQFKALIDNSFLQSLLTHQCFNA